MRKLMWFTVGFVIACVIGVYLSVGVWLAVVTALIAVLLYFCKSTTLRIIAVILTGITVGSIWLCGYHSVYLKNIRRHDGQTITGQLTVTDYSYDTDYGVAADCEIKLDDRRYQVRAYLNSSQPMSPGDVIIGKLRLRLTTADSLQGSTYHQGDGIFLLAYVAEDAQIQRSEHLEARFFAAWLRRQITDIIDKVFPDDAIAFARALLLGDSSLLTYEQDTAFKLSGIRHVIAVSGLHVSILFSLVYTLGGKRRITTALFGIPVLIIFAAVAGFTPSVVRACIMQGLVILALLFKKEYDPPSALAFAVLVMLGINPMTITSVGFQLSAGCLVGIFLFYSKINGYLVRRMGVEKGMDWKARLLRWLSGTVSVSLSTMIATTPLSAGYFGTVSLVSILTNVLTLWVISFIFYGIMLACVLGVIWLPGAKVVAWVVSWPIRYVQMMAKLLSGFTLSAVYTCSIYIVIWLIFCYIILAVFLCGRHKRPGILVLCTITGLITAVALSWLEPRLDNCRVTVLDVGQGQAILLQSGDRNYLVDCGGDAGNMVADAVAQQLFSQGISRLDGLILTHYDKDHTGGADPLLSRIQTDALYLPDIADDGDIRAVLTEKYLDRISWIREDTFLTAETMKLSLFPADEKATGNESCLCILFQTENCDILITGDLSASGEQRLLENAELPKLELLVVGHHGSASSTGFALLRATRPDTAVISLGKDNYHGHPSEEVLFRLRLFGCRVLRTDQDGTIIFRG